MVFIFLDHRLDGADWLVDRDTLRREIEAFNAVLRQEWLAVASNILPQSSSRPTISSDQILQVARLDAERVYGDLTPYRITLVLEADGWHVDYDLKDPNLNGGGPHYLIDAGTGQIISKWYEQ
jgi:hypothetical protein